MLLNQNNAIGLSDVWLLFFNFLIIFPCNLNFYIIYSNTVRLVCTMHRVH